MLVALATVAAAQAADPDTVLAEIVKLRGIRQNLEGLPLQIQASVEQSLKQMPPAMAERLGPPFRRNIPEAYKPEFLLRILVGNLKRNYDAAQAAAVLQMLRSPLQQKISQLQGQASRPERMKEMEEYAAKLAATPPPAGRLALLKELDDVGGDSEWAVTLNLEIIRAQHKASQRFVPEAARMTDEQFEDRLKQIREQMRGPVQNRLRVFLLFAFSALSDEELKQWITQWKSEPARWFDKIMKQGFQQMMSTAAEDLVGRMTEDLPAK